MGRHRLIGLLFVLLGPVGWFLFWSVFHTVPGQDWVVFHTAAALVNAHDFSTLADPKTFTETLNATHREWFAKPISALHPWLYPPVALLLAEMFGWMPYPVSLVAFLALSTTAMAAALWGWQTKFTDRLALVFFVLLCPASAFALGAGQLSFFVAAIVMGGMALLTKKPFYAGLVFSLLCLKPQFALLMPIALAAGRHFRAIAGAAIGGLVLVLASLAAFGFRPWVDWISFATGSSVWFAPMMRQMRLYDQSVHSTLHMLGFNETIAGIGQTAAFGVAALCVWLAFARPVPLRQRSIVLLCALVAGAPHVSDYDHVLLAIAIMLILLGERTLRRGEAGLAASVWLATLINPPALIAVLGLPVLTLFSAATGLLPIVLMVREASLLF